MFMFGFFNSKTVGVAVFGADGLEDNGYYEAEDLVWLVVHNGVVYNADVTYNDENTSYSVGQYSEGGYISVYSIDRTTTPNKIVFTGAPVWQQQENTKTVQEPLAVDNIALHGIGNYIRCEIETSGILDGSAGPFLILDSVCLLYTSPSPRDS
mgnify:CR=1 FL=1